MAAITVTRTKPEADVVRTTFGRLGVRHADGNRMTAKVTWRHPRRITIERAALDPVLPWAKSQDFPRAWLRLAEGARAAGSIVVEHTRDVLVIDDEVSSAPRHHLEQSQRTAV